MTIIIYVAKPPHVSSMYHLMKRRLKLLLIIHKSACNSHHYFTNLYLKHMHSKNNEKVYGINRTICTEHTANITLSHFENLYPHPSRLKWQKKPSELYPRVNDCAVSYNTDNNTAETVLQCIRKNIHDILTSTWSAFLTGNFFTGFFGALFLL